MKKSIIFMTLIGVIVLSLCGSVAAADNDTMNTTIIPNYYHVYINVSNDNGVKYNLDYDYNLNDPVRNVNGTNGTYYIRAEGGGMNQLHITNSNGTTDAELKGQVTIINSNSTSNSGVFYITTTGGRGSNDDIILLLSMKGPIPDNFSVTIRSSGYTWTLPSPAGYGQPTTYPGAQHITGINETFTKSDFLYGPQTQRPGTSNAGWQPLYYGQTTSDPSTAEYLMFIDLYVGNLASGKLPNMIDNGAVKVEYTFNNMNSTASFNAYAWTVQSYQYEGISWTNPSNQVHTVNYTPVTPVASFTADNTTGSDSLTVKFTDKSANEPTSWLWDFGDGTTSTEQNPTHTYSTPGVYTVKLTASNLAGNDTETKTGYITVLKSNVYVNITTSNPNPQVGDKVTYTFKLGNKGPGVAKDVVFTYVIPDGVEFAGANVDQGTWTYNETTRTLTWTLGDVAIGDPKLWLDLNILSAGSFNINPLVTVSGNNIGSEGNIDSLLVNAVSVPATVNAATETSTVPMQTTGVPVAGLAMALLMIGSGWTLGKRK